MAPVGVVSWYMLLDGRYTSYRWEWCYGKLM